MKAILFFGMVLIISFSNTYAQLFHNLDFSQSCDTSKTGLCHWDLSWGGKGACTAGYYDGGPCLLINGKTTSSVGFAEQSACMGKTEELQIIEVSAKISSENVDGKGAGLNIGIYGPEGKLLGNKDMGYASFNWVFGTSSWKKYTLKIVCPLGAVKIKIGAILYGKGTARFDDFKVLIIPVYGRTPSQLAIKYISSACDTIEKNSLVRDSVNIESLKKDALLIAGPAKNYADCYPAVEYLISSLRPFGDEHSFFMKAGEVAKFGDYKAENGHITFAEYKLIDSCGYILVPAFQGANKKLIGAYADTLQNAIKKLNKQRLKGWIIDLREDMGGNMEPMIAGLGPLFSSDTLGYLVDANGRKSSWSYKDYIADASDPATISRPLPIAVLTGPRTGSSGEIVVISFIGNAKTKSFGQPTWGLTTGNGDFDLMDGARMKLASTVMADRNGKLYHGPIKPDVVTDKNSHSKIDETLNEAIAYLKNQVN